MQCHEIMKSEVESFRETDSIMEIARRMREVNIGFAPITDRDGRPLGTITDRDMAIRVCAEDRRASRTAASEVMSHEAVTCRASEDVDRAEEIMSEHHKSRLMIVDEAGRLVGVLSLSDIFAEAAGAKATETFRRIAEREVRPH
jgi:CBS domain-containing protein